MKKIKYKKIVTRRRFFCILIILLLVFFTVFANRNSIKRNKKYANITNELYKTEQNLDFSKVLTSNPNVPHMGAGMIPIRYNKTKNKFEIAYKTNWYNYNLGEVAFMMLSDRIL